MRNCIYLIALLASASVHADCATPTAVAGTITYTGGAMKFCDGSAWQTMKGASVAGGCTAAGKLEYVPNSDFVWCDGTEKWSAKGSVTFGACAANGQWLWDSGNTTIKGCVGGTWYSLKPTVGSDAGSIIQNTPGTYSHTFTSSATVTVAYLKGGGGGGGDCYNEQDGMAGNPSQIIYDGLTVASAGGGGGADWNCGAGAAGTGSNSIGGTNGSNGGSGGGGCGPSAGGAGGSVTGGSFSVTAGKSVTVIVGGGGAGACGNGIAGSVSLTW